MSWLLGALLLGAASILIAMIPKPRLFWGSAAIDPTSFPWIISFMLYGPLAALLSSLMGALAIALLSPEPTPRLGAALKFVGTACVWGTWWALMQAGVIACSGSALSPPTALLALVPVAGLVRCLVEVPACYVAIPYYMSRTLDRRVSPREALSEFGGVGRYVLIMSLFNLWLTLLDSAIPWALVYPTDAYKTWGTW